MKQKIYQILDVGVSLESNADELLNMFDLDYSWFSVPSLNCRNLLTVGFQVNEAGGCTLLRVNETRSSLEDHPFPAAYAYQAVSRKLMGQVDDFLVLHAGAVARDGEALIVSGPAGAGKTTLALKLLESGCSFLSDDFCPIHKNTGFVHSFTRSLWVSRQSPFAAKSDRNPAGSVFRGNKVPINPGGSSIPVADRPGRIKALICLDPVERTDSWCELQVGLRKEGETELIGSLEALDGVTIEKMNTGSSQWRIRYPANQGHAGRLKALLARHGHSLWNVYRMDRIAPDFAKEPALIPVSFHEAAFNVMREMKQELAGEPDNCEGSVTGVFMKLIELLEGAPCYRLSPGRLETMRDLALQAANWSDLRKGEK